MRHRDGGMNETIKIELEKLKEVVVTTVPVEQIYLFGSYANGMSGKDSDLDLYVVLNDNVQMRLIDAIAQIRLAIDRQIRCPWIFLQTH